jgi:hypothetical protein
VIEMRPLYRYTTTGSIACGRTIFVASLAFLLDCALEKKLKASGLDISSKEARQLLQTVRIVEIDLSDGQRKRSVTHGSARAAHILQAIGITDLDHVSAATRKIRSFVFNMLRALTASIASLTSPSRE